MTDRELAIAGWANAVSCYHDEHGIAEDREEFDRAVESLAPEGQALPEWLIEAVWQRLGWQAALTSK